VEQSERLTMTVAEAAAVLGVSPSAAYGYVRMGQIPSIRLGRRILIPVSGLRELVDGPAL
jgi:excisionase family DNA binding protein